MKRNMFNLVAIILGSLVASLAGFAEAGAETPFVIKNDMGRAFMMKVTFAKEGKEISTKKLALEAADEIVVEDMALLMSPVKIEFFDRVNTSGHGQKKNIVETRVGCVVVHKPDRERFIHVNLVKPLFSDKGEVEPQSGTFRSGFKKTAHGLDVAKNVHSDDIKKIISNYECDQFMVAGVKK